MSGKGPDIADGNGPGIAVEELSIPKLANLGGKHLMDIVFYSFPLISHAVV